jgi:hypothetical protein
LEITEFRIEPAESTVSLSGYLRRPESRFGPGLSQAAIESLMLGFLLRGKLCESERDLLPLLVPAPKRLVLVHGSSDLGSTGQPHLIKQACESNGARPIGAIFTDHISAKSKDGREACRMHSAPVGYADGLPLTLIMTEPDRYDRDDEVYTAFAHLVNRFRQALASAESAAQRLKSMLEADHPVLVINRASGRVLAVNGAGLDLFAQFDTDFVDREYSSIAPKLVELATSRPMRMSNIAVDDFRLAVVELMPSPKRTTDLGPDRFFSEFFVHTMRNKIAAVTAAASHMESYRGHLATEVIEELTGIILNEAGELNRHLERMRLLVSADHLPRRTVRLFEEVDGAVAKTGGYFGVGLQSIIDEAAETATVQAPRGAIENLVEAALMAHLTPAPHDRAPEVRLSVDEDSARIDLTSRISGQARTGVSGKWQAYVRRLCDALGYSCQITSDTDDLLETRITLPETTKGRHHDR